MTMDRKGLERQQRKGLLLEAAGRVFGRKPFEEATMQEVASEAQIGMQGLYEHFASKQDLYEQVVARRAEHFLAQAEAILRVDRPPLEQLRAMFLIYADQFKGRVIWLPMFIHDRVHYDWGFESRFLPRLKEIYETERARLKGILRVAVEVGQLQDLDVEFLTQLCFGVLEASLYHSHRSGIEEEPSACVERAMACFLRGAGARA
ncbi:TetR/AcrR family transcriptional regulator [Geothrix campi]|uniref:TetR/AcrR family transcriptional regulator n=1 Tax=Geothrix campi TaxID=2966450 RepID=UPI002147234E|nr:TetR/AcrR family transcriptional regulator [Geothrix sp. SG10]